MNEVRLGIDVACRADHQASLADETGRFLWQGWKFRTTTADLETLWAKIPDDVPVRHRTSIQKRRTSCAMRLDALLELLGPGWLELFGTISYGKAAVAVLERYANPHALRKLGQSRLTKLLIRASRGQFREDKADEILAAAAESRELWAAGGLDFDELAEDIAVEIRLIKLLDAEIAVLDDRIEALYETADPAGIISSAPGIGVTTAAGILGRTGDLNRFASLAGVRAFTGLVPKIDQSGIEDHNKGPTKHGDPGLRQTLFLAADLARKVDPTLAARYHRLYVEQGKHHNSAICTLAAVLMTRIAACWRNGQLYKLRDVDSRLITADEGRRICADRYRIDPATRTARRNPTTSEKLKRAGRDKKESQSAPVTSPPQHQPTKAA